MRFPADRGGWDDLNVSAKEDGISWGSSNEFLFWDSREIRCPRSQGHGGQRMLPRKVQGAGPSIVPGSDRSTLIIIASTRGGREQKGSAKIVQGPASSLLAHPLPLETRCVWQSKLGMRPTSKAENRIDKTRIIITPRHAAGRLWADKP